MRAVVQRVSRAQVSVGREIAGQIGLGLLVLLGVGRDDREADASYLAGKICELRIFEDEHGKMNRNVQEAGGSVLAVSQFTLYGDVRRGRRPSFDAAAPAETARNLYKLFVEQIRAAGFALRDGTLSGNDEGGPGERRAGDDITGFGQGLLDTRSMAFFGAYFHQTLRHQDKAQNLSPLGNDVADHLSPLAVWVHGFECRHPGDAGDDQKQREGVLAQKFQRRRPLFALWLLALG